MYEELYVTVFMIERLGKTIPVCFQHK